MGPDGIFKDKEWRSNSIQLFFLRKQWICIFFSSDEKCFQNKWEFFCLKRHRSRISGYKIVHELIFYYFLSLFLRFWTHPFLLITNRSPVKVGNISHSAIALLQNCASIIPCVSFSTNPLAWQRLFFSSLPCRMIIIANTLIFHPSNNYKFTSFSNEEILR